MNNLLQGLTYLFVVVNLVLLVVIISKQEKCCSSSASLPKARDYPTESCAYNCPTPYDSTLSPEACALECNANPSDCCNSVCDYDASTKTFGNCTPPDGVHCGTIINC